LLSGKRAIEFAGGEIKNFYQKEYEKKHDDYVKLKAHSQANILQAVQGRKKSLGKAFLYILLMFAWAGLFVFVFYKTQIGLIMFICVIGSLIFLVLCLKNLFKV
jgi:CHASE2 domain-containing sensor protein